MQMKTLIARTLRVLAWLAGAAVWAIASLSFIFWTHKGDGGYERSPFEREAWLHGTHEAQGEFPRLGMADDLIAKETLRGMRKDAVLALLGEPEGRDVLWSEEDRFDLLYRLGPERGYFSVDSEWLGITFDKSGKVARYKLVRD